MHQKLTIRFPAGGQKPLSSRAFPDGVSRRNGSRSLGKMNARESAIRFDFTDSISGLYWVEIPSENPIVH